MIVRWRWPHTRRACPKRPLTKRLAGASMIVPENGHHLIQIVRRDPRVSRQRDNAACDRSSAWTWFLIWRQPEADPHALVESGCTNQGGGKAAWRAAAGRLKAGRPGNPARTA